MTRLTIVHANVHGSPRAARRAVRLGGDIVALNEAPPVGKVRARGCRKMQATPVHAKGPTGRRREVSGDTATLVRRTLPHLGEWHQQVSQQVDQWARVTPDRWVTVTAQQVGGVRHAHINAHLSVPMPGQQRTRQEYAESVAWIARMIRLYRVQGYVLSLNADFNAIDKAVDPSWSPYRMLARSGFEWFDHRIDTIAWDAKAFDVLDRSITPARRIGSDHDALRVVLNLKEK